MMTTMGWGKGTNADGRPVGYLIDAECDRDGCEAEIDRGLAYACGGAHDGGEHGCGGYFCAKHLSYVTGEREVAGVMVPYVSAQLCEKCTAAYEAPAAP